MKQILIRKTMLHGATSKLVRCDVLSENADGSFRCKCEGDAKPVEVKASEAISAEKVFGQVRTAPGAAVIQKAYPASPYALSNMKR
jgi:hypothetical protein